MFGVAPLLIKVVRKFDCKEKVKLEDILLLNEKNGNYFTILLVALLSMIPTPFPIPFVSIFFGSILILLIFQMLFGKTTKLYIPKSILNISFKKKMIEKVINKILPRVNGFELYVRRKDKSFEINKKFLFFVNLCLLFASIIIIIPIPLLSTVPSIAVMLICFGLINKSKIFINIGLFLVLLSVLITILFYLFGKFIALYLMSV